MCRIWLGVKFGNRRTVFDVAVYRLGVDVARVVEIAELGLAREGVGLEPLEQGQVHASARERVLWSVGVAINQAWHKEALSEGLHLVRHLARVRAIWPPADQVTNLIGGERVEVGHAGDHTGGVVVDEEAVAQDFELAEGL